MGCGDFIYEVKIFLRGEVWKLFIYIFDNCEAFFSDVKEVVEEVFMDRVQLFIICDYYGCCKYERGFGCVGVIRCIR